jgi:hypothetical protein
MIKRKFAEMLARDLTDDVVERFATSGEEVRDRVEKTVALIERCLVSNRLTKKDRASILVSLRCQDEKFRQDGASPSALTAALKQSLVFICPALLRRAAPAAQRDGIGAPPSGDRPIAGSEPSDHAWG